MLLTYLEYHTIISFSSFFYIDFVDRNINNPIARKKSETIKKLRRKIATLQQRENRTKKRKTVTKKDDNIDKAALMKLCKENLSKEMADIVSLSLSNQKSRGQRYSEEIKSMSLSICNISPVCYKHLRNFFSLPSITTLKRTTASWKCENGINDSFLNEFASKLANSSEEYRTCMLYIDEISLKSDSTEKAVSSKAETHRTVLMARGILHDWKQPVAYWAVNESINAEELKATLQEFIRKLVGIGLIVKVFESDMGPNFQWFAKILGVAPDNPYFFVDDMRIFYIFDVPHLFICTRNCLLNHSIEVSTTGETILWKYIQQVYKHDSKLQYRLAHKLTNSHMDPSNKDKLVVKYAVQALSSTMAACINTYISCGALPNAAMATAEFVSKFDGLFDLLNSAEQTHETKPLKSGFSGTKQQTEYLRDMKAYISSLKVRDDYGNDVTNNHPFLRGWLITIGAVEGLWEILKIMDGVEFLPTQRLNQYTGKIKVNYETNPKTAVEQFGKGPVYQDCPPRSTIGSTIESTNLENDQNYCLFGGDEVFNSGVV